jgi:hypothetical protein
MRRCPQVLRCPTRPVRLPETHWFPRMREFIPSLTQQSWRPRSLECGEIRFRPVRLTASHNFRAKPTGHGTICLLSHYQPGWLVILVQSTMRRARMRGGETTGLRHFRPMRPWWHVHRRAVPPTQRTAPRCSRMQTAYLCVKSVLCEQIARLLRSPLIPLALLPAQKLMWQSSGRLVPPVQHGKML